ncbi:MAG: F0F1 ATP synthase subunit epsilon [Bacteroidetes bacterium]|nr:F0F1 ATP synthase subunit epsilon [Bacteroidota bacterium]
MAGNNDLAAVDTFRLEILTPQKSVFSGEVESFTAPGESGSFQVLRNHAPLLSSIAAGEVRLVDQSGDEFIYSTSGGFVEVNHNKANFLADTLEKKEEIDIERARQAKARAEERLKKNEAGTDIARAQAALLRALNRLKVAER